MNPAEKALLIIFLPSVFPTASHFPFAFTYFPAFIQILTGWLIKKNKKKINREERRKERRSGRRREKFGAAQ